MTFRENLPLGAGTAILVLLILAAELLSARGTDSTACKNNPNLQLVGDCFKVHGRLQLYNGTPSARIWRIGTKRILGVHQTWDENGSEVLFMPKSLLADLDFGVLFYGDFEVCPLTKEKPGEMQIVCVQSVSNLVVKDLRKSKKAQD